MTYKEWERELLGHLKTLPKQEREEVAEYYSEMYGEKSDAGMTDSEILENFGEPKTVAERILTDDSREDGDNEKKEYPQQKINTEKTKSTDEVKGKRGISISKIVGWFFLITLVIIPIDAIVISVIATFGAVTVAGAAMLIGGIIAAIASPFGLIIGYTGAGVFATMGACLAAAGIGAILFIIFYFITRYLIITTYKVAKYVVVGRSTK